MHCVAAKFVLWLLSEDQKQNHVNVNKQLVDCANADEKLFKEHHHSWWNLGLWLSCHNKSHLCNGSKNCHPDPKMHCQFGPLWKWCYVFWLWGCNSSWISTSWSDGEQEILFEGDGKAERGSEEIKAWFVEVGKNGWSIMTTLGSILPFWFVILSQNMRQCSSPSLRTRQTLHQGSSSSSTSWNPYWKDEDLRLSRWVKKIRWQS